MEILILACALSVYNLWLTFKDYKAMRITFHEVSHEKEKDYWDKYNRHSSRS